MSGGRSEKKTDFLGNEYIQHYDDRGQPIGRSEVKKDFWGDEYVQHYDNKGQVIGRSEQRESILGGTYTQHYDNKGQATGRSEERESILGGTYTQHYDNQGQTTGRSEQRESFFGGTYTQHTGSNHYTAPSNPTPPPSSGSNSRTEELGGIFTPVYISSAGTSTPGFSVSLVSGLAEVCCVLFFLAVAMIFAADPLLQFYGSNSFAFYLILTAYAVITPFICLFSRCKKHGLTGAAKRAAWWFAAADLLVLLSAVPLARVLLWSGSIEHFVDFLRTHTLWLPVAVYSLVHGLITVIALRKTGEQALPLRKVSDAFHAHGLASFAGIYGMLGFLADRMTAASGWFLWTLECALMCLFLMVMCCVMGFLCNIPYVILCKYPKKQ